MAYTLIKKSYLRQLGASFRMLETCIQKANPKTWRSKINKTPYWFICYHLLCCTEFYFHANPKTFKPPKFERKPTDKPISKATMLGYHKLNAKKAAQFINGMNAAYFSKPSPFEWHNGFPMIDLID